VSINYMPVRNVYPTAGVASLGQMVTAGAPGPGPEEIAVGGGGEVATALTVGGQANPLVGLLVFLALVAASMWAAQRLGQGDGQFANIKASAYNALVISWIAILGIPIWKFVFTRFKVPGVSTWVHAV
jgi:hypothetical protein